MPLDVNCVHFLTDGWCKHKDAAGTLFGPKCILYEFEFAITRDPRMSCAVRVPIIKPEPPPSPPIVET